MTELRRNNRGVRRLPSYFGEQPDSVAKALESLSDEVAQDLSIVIPLKPEERTALTHDLVNWGKKALLAV
jgi:hypothetical protein